MEYSLFIEVPAVDLQFAVLALLAVAGLLAVTGRLALEAARPVQAGQAAVAQVGSVAPLTPEWLERLITGAGAPVRSRPTAAEREMAGRNAA